jgi:SAM-dependent methyltransferase
VISPRRWARASVELLDDPSADAATVVACLGDVARINRLFGGARAALVRLDGLLRTERTGAPLTLLDVGTGVGDIPAAAARLARRRGLDLRLLGVERHGAAASEAQRRNGVATCVADGFRLPLGDRSVDYVLCSQLLHHFDADAAVRLVAELDRVARRGVVIADLRRSALAAAGIFLASFPLRLHPTTRRDGVISVFRGFTVAELGALCHAAGVRAAVRRHAGFRLTAAWSPDGARP